MPCIPLMRSRFIPSRTQGVRRILSKCSKRQISGHFSCSLTRLAMLPPGSDGTLPPSLHSKAPTTLRVADVDEREDVSAPLGIGLARFGEEDTIPSNPTQTSSSVSACACIFAVYECAPMTHARLDYRCERWRTGRRLEPADSGTSDDKRRSNEQGDCRYKPLHHDGSSTLHADCLKEPDSTIQKSSDLQIKEDSRRMRRPPLG